MCGTDLSKQSSTNVTVYVAGFVHVSKALCGLVQRCFILRLEMVKGISAPGKSMPVYGFPVSLVELCCTQNGNASMFIAHLSSPCLLVHLLHFSQSGLFLALRPLIFKHPTKLGGTTPVHQIRALIQEHSVINHLTEHRDSRRSIGCPIRELIDQIQVMYVVIRYSS